MTSQSLKGKKLYIIRHGNTFDAGDVVTRVGGRTDLRLSNSGKEQAKALGEHFAEKGITFDQMLAGPLVRTRETASLIASRLGQAITIEIEEGLREIDYGPDENQPEDTVVARVGQAALDLWEEEAIPAEDWLVDVNGLIDFWLALFRYWQESETTLAVVTSNGIARFALKAAEAKGQSLKLKTGSYGVLSLKDGKIDVEGWNIRP